MRRDYSFLRKNQSVAGDSNSKFLKSSEPNFYSGKTLEIKEEGCFNSINPQFVGYALIFSLGGVA